MTRTMITEKGSEYVARWIENMLTTTRCEWVDIQHAVAGAYYSTRTDDSYIPTTDVTIDHVGDMTPEQARDAVARIAEADQTYRLEGKPLPTGRHCAVCGATATMAASTGPACDTHYDDLS